MKGFFVIILLLALPACSTLDRLLGEADSSQANVWPQPPDQTRIKYLYSFRNANDLGYSSSIFKRFWQFIAGKKNDTMVRPYAIAVQGSLIAVTDPGLGLVHLFDQSEKRYIQIRKAGKTKLVSPVGVGIGVNKIYIADSVLAKVFVFDRRGHYLSSTEGFARPSGIAVDKDSQRLYVADTLNHHIVVFDDSGKRLFNIGERGEVKGKFNYPSHLYQHGDKLYVNDTMNFRIQAFDLDGNFLTAFGTHGKGSGHFAQPKGVGVNSEGHIFVADAKFNRVQIFDPEGGFLLAFGGQGIDEGSFWLPAGLTVAKDKIYVADSYNRRVQVFQYIGGD